MSISKFVISGSGRCGSTMMTSSLKQNPDIKMFGEIFNRHAKSVDKSIFDNWEPYDIDDLETHKSYCTKQACIRAHEKYDGYKLLFGHIHNDVEEYLKDIKVVILTRNPFNTAISSIVANMTRKYYCPDPFLETVTVDPTDIENRINHTIDRISYYARYADLVLRYEDSFQENYDKVCRLVGASHFIPEVITRVRIRRPLSEVVTNYREVEHFDREYDL